MAPRKTVGIRAGWDNLKPATQKRYLSKGVTPELYSRGASLAKARGHFITPERPSAGYVNVAKKRGLLEAIGDQDAFSELSRDEQRELAELYIKGFLTKGQGAVKNPTRKKGTRLQRRASDTQKEAQFDFFRLVEDYGIDIEDKQFYKLLREGYSGTFTAQAA